MRVLMLAYHYPPSQAVGALRASKVVTALRARGHEVVVLTARLLGEAQEIRERTIGLEVRALRELPSPRAVYLRAKRRLSQASEPATRSAQEKSWPADLPAWKRRLLSFVWLPDDKQGFIASVVLHAIFRLRSRFDLLYTTAPPASAHVAGLLLHRLKGVPWAVEFRDPWMDNIIKVDRPTSKAATAVESWLEKKCLTNSRYVIPVSQGIYRLLEPKLTTDKGPTMILVRNGIDRLLPARRPVEPGHPFTIIHAGSLYHGRDPRQFLAALAAVKQQFGLTPQQITLEFIGHGRRFAGESIEGHVDSLGLTDLVRFRNWLPLEASRDLMERADLLLLLAQRQPDQVPNKLYDYLGTRVPILALVDEGGETATMLQAVGGHYVITQDDPVRIAEALATALGFGQASAPEGCDEEVLQTWTTDREFARLFEKFGDRGHRSRTAP